MNSETKYTNPKDVLGAGKVPMELFPAAAIALGSMALLEGALKYGRSNFRVAGVRSSIYVAAAMRHLLDWFNGEDKAKDSGVDHLGHVLACVAILVDARAQGALNDDRLPYQDTSAFFKQLEEDVKRLKAQYADKDPKHYTLLDVPAPAVFEGILPPHECMVCGTAPTVFDLESQRERCQNPDCGYVRYHHS
jgi:hypothetical protein